MLSADTYNIIRHIYFIFNTPTYSAR